MHDSLLSGYSVGLEKLGYGVQYQQPQPAPQPKRSILGAAAKGLALGAGAIGATAGAGIAKRVVKHRDKVAPILRGASPLHKDKMPTKGYMKKTLRRVALPSGGVDKGRRKSVFKAALKGAK